MSCDQENSEYTLQVGKALDSLKSDYPKILVKDPDYTIYESSIVARDPSGFEIHGIGKYRQVFSLLHTIVNLFYCQEKSLLTFRMVHDQCHNNIRVSWNTEVVPKKIFGGTKTTLHVDGISVYELNSKGKVREHHIERLLINDKPFERGIVAALQEKVVDTDFIPAYSGTPETERGPRNLILRFQQPSLFSQPKSLFSSDEKKISRETLELFSSRADNVEHDSQYPGLDWDALESKNKSRKKFGLKPLSPEEFLELEAQVQQMEMQERAKHAANSDATEVPASKKSSKGGILKKIFGEVLEDTCESNFDCQQPEVCCDFGFKKSCCRSGTMVRAQQEPVRIPVTKDSGYMNGW
eukprot:CAMPEP_0194210864 /NCGR_PEP_ID=MMETSP0156-20130528/9155_1 /TAXON_ID=33649 /ORGANISM="Thalassionema nitzschioides, Strain L26-B" /LENGTH=352 /DNA_ID=CAMNT_0038938275 /DNA_START=312 /DNA_END=1367 /DNA_ORIENTATION=-